MADGLTVWLAASAALLVIAAASGRARTIRLFLLAAALALLGHGIATGSLPLAIAGGLVAVAAALRLSGIALTPGGRFNDDEREMVEALPGLSKPAARHLIDQGVWLDAKPGDVLTRQGEPVGHLYYLASGSVHVASNGAPVGEAQAGGFIGEITVLTGAPATGTVTVDRPSRLWCAPAAPLRAYADSHDDVRRALEAAFRQALADKLVATNRRLAGAPMSAGSPGS